MIKRLAKEENAYNQAMLSFQKDCIALDEHLTGTLKKILVSFYLICSLITIDLI